MKKPLSVLVALAFALSLAATALADTKKAKSHQITGIVETVDDAAGTLTVRGKKISVRLKAGDTVELSEIQVGEKVLVQYRGDTAYSVKKVSARKTAKEETAPASAPAGK